MCGRWGLALWGDSIVTLFAAQHCNAFCGASIVAHFARKVRGTKVAAIALPLKGRVFKIQKKSRTIFDQINAITH